MFEFCLLFLQITILVAVLFHTQANHFFVVTHAILLLNYWLSHKFKLLQYTKFNYLTMYLPHISNSWLTEINVFCNIYIYIYIKVQIITCLQSTRHINEIPYRPDRWPSLRAGNDLLNKGNSTSGEDTTYWNKGIGGSVMWVP